jgi:hypothetical protein
MAGWQEGVEGDTLSSVRLSHRGREVVEGGGKTSHLVELMGCSLIILLHPAKATARACQGYVTPRRYTTPPTTTKKTRKKLIQSFSFSPM